MLKRIESHSPRSEATPDGKTLAAMFRAQARVVKVLEKVPTPYIRRPALEKALASNSPAVVEVVSDVDAMSKRAWRPSAT